MREIKFRYWDMVRKEFITDGDVYFVAEDIIFAGDLNNLPLVDVTGHVQMSQFTGLKDKNGKEIYEGDIYKRYDSIFVVIFDVLGFKCKKVYDSWLEKNVYNQNEISLLSKVDSDYCYEVIGNIYENPELLAGEQNE